MVSTTISTGVFSSLTGVLMKWDLNMSYYSLLAFSLIFAHYASTIIQALREESGAQGEKKEIELALIKI